MVAFKALAVSLLLGLVVADECPALSNTFGQKPKNLFDLETVDCRVGIQAAECATNLRQSYGQTWAAFRINHNKDCNHGAPYGDCCCFAGKPPVEPDNLEPNPSSWLFFWDTTTTGENEGFGTQCNQDPTTGCCGRQDAGKVTVTGGCPYDRSTVRFPFDDQGNFLAKEDRQNQPLVVDMFGRVGDGCPSVDGGKSQTTAQTDPSGAKLTPASPGDNGNSNGDPSAPVDGQGNGDPPPAADTFGDSKLVDNGAGAGGGGGGGGRLARFRRLRRLRRQVSSSKKRKGGGGGGGGSGSGGGGRGPTGDPKRRVVSGAGPGGFPKCGPYGNFGPEKQCKKDITAMCKPGVKNKGTGGNKGRMPKGGTGDLDGTTCPNSKNTGGLTRGGKTSPKSPLDTQLATQQDAAGGTTPSDPAGGTTPSDPTGETTPPDPSTSNRRLRRWAAMDSFVNLFKRWDGNQWDHSNAGQLKAKGKCCWCQAENGGGGGGGGGGKKSGGKGGKGKGGGGVQGNVEKPGGGDGSGNGGG